MKTAEEVLDKIIPFEGNYRHYCEEDVLKAMESYATEREQKWKELYEKQKEYNKNEFMIDQLFPAKNEKQEFKRSMLQSRNETLRQQIAALEKELGLNKE